MTLVATEDNTTVLITPSDTLTGRTRTPGLSRMEPESPTPLRSTPASRINFVTKTVKLSTQI